jgi:hypothetical protein
MTRVYTQKARKDYPQFGIKKGDTYYRWAFFRQPEQMSLKYPTRSQLTNDEGKVTVYNAFDGFSVAEGDGADPAGDIRNMAEAMGEAEQSFRERFDNMPEGLQQGDTGQALEANADACSSAQSELESLADEVEDEENDTYRNEDEGGGFRAYNVDAIVEAVSALEPDLQ